MSNLARIIDSGLFRIFEGLFGGIFIGAILSSEKPGSRTILLWIGGIGLFIIACSYIYSLAVKHRRSDESKEIFAYLDGLHNDVGLFIQQYYDSDSAQNAEKSKSLQTKMKAFVPLLSQHKLSISNKTENELTGFFDMLFDFKRRTEGTISCSRDEAAYRRWLEIRTEFDDKAMPVLNRLKKRFK